MRTKKTNFLQIIVLISGITYALLGIISYLSLIYFVKLIGIDVHEDWLKEIPNDAFISLVYFLLKGYAAMLFSIGLSMVLPLFGPLKYRGLIYFTGILFPLLSSIILLYYGLDISHMVILVIGVVFLTILILTFTALMITRDEAKEGLE